ncbi:DinB family protein [Constantimarinum furrinae]|uniref:DinB-like domain-containing protein n=1 Tax=Constantimarinum furrinae TaxID=2562285 RepID=A0A7G8PXV2_9FLAO|nr:DinB family protein [Constantimarinum furrinae]QNJ99168.1 hypothetical protein ALE3EI_2641 [Constantimarinum furrinae]
MKKFILPLLVLALVSFTVADTPLTEAERDFAIYELNASHKHMMEVLDGLTEDQLNYKSTPDSWSIAECAEHIAISEENIFGMLQGTLQSDADPSKRSEVKLSDEELLKMIKDRSNKVKTSEPFEPTGKYGSFEATVDAFNNKRKANMDYVLNTQDDLRNRYAQLPFGTIDAYQVLLFMSGHTERHVKQMEEIIEDPDFPMK